MGWGKEFRACPQECTFLKGYFCPNFRGGAEKVVVHMHWLTWLLWRPCQSEYTTIIITSKAIELRNKEAQQIYSIQ